MKPQGPKGQPKRTPKPARSRGKDARKGLQDPLAYRPVRIVDGGPAPVRPAPTPGAGPRVPRSRRNRRRIPPVVLWNRRFRALKNLLLFTLFCETIWLGLTSPKLMVRKVVVSGAHMRDGKQIQQIAGLTHPGNIFRAPVGKARKKLSALPEVAEAHVERRLPNTLAVVLTERQPLASVFTGKEYWVIDRAGLVYRRQGAPVANRPVLAAKLKGPVTLGKPLPVAALPAALQCLAKLPETPLAKTAWMHVEATGEAWIADPDGLKVRLGPLDDAPDRLAVTDRLLRGPDGPELLKVAQSIDMTTPQSEVYTRRPEYQDTRLSDISMASADDTTTNAH